MEPGGARWWLNSMTSCNPSLVTPILTDLVSTTNLRPPYLWSPSRQVVIDGPLSSWKSSSLSLLKTRYSGFGFSVLCHYHCPSTTELELPGCLCILQERSVSSQQGNHLLVLLVRLWLSSLSVGLRDLPCVSPPGICWPYTTSA